MKLAIKTNDTVGTQSFSSYTQLSTSPPSAIGVTPFRGRSIDTNAPVHVYRNLHRQSFSIRQHGLVVGHAESLCLQDAAMHVNDAGRKRVIRNKRKEVHAWIEGWLCDHPRPSSLQQLEYNPYKFGRFVCDGQAVLWSCHIWLFNGKAYLQGDK